MRISEPLGKALRQLDESLHGLPVNWLIGGSCGLLLQGVPLAAEPRDLDVYADVKAARAIYACLAHAATDKLIASETDIYHSELSHFRLGEVTMELVGGFEVSSEGSEYKVEIDDLLIRHHTMHAWGGINLRLMPLAHEFSFNVLRGRPDRFEAIAAVMRSLPDVHYPAMADLMRRYTFGDPFLLEAERQLRFAEWERKAGYEPGSPFFSG